MRCDQCGYDYASVPRLELSDRLWREGEALIGDFVSVRLMHERPEPEVWSALEYGCHVRDVLDVQKDRVDKALLEVVPAFVPMGREERAIGYHREDPAEVAVAIRQNSERLAETLDALDDTGWARTGVYNYPTRTERSIEWIAAHTVHEVIHHHDDIVAVGSGRVP